MFPPFPPFGPPQPRHSTLDLGRVPRALQGDTSTAADAPTWSIVSGPATRRRILAQCGGAAALLATGTACANAARNGSAVGAGARPTPKTGVKLSFMSWGTQPAFDVRTRWAAQFQSQYPG